MPDSNQAFSRDFAQLVANNLKAPANQKAEILIQAVTDANIAAVKYLVSKGFNVNFHNDSRETALMWAIKIDNIQITELLVNIDAKIDDTDELGDTALMIAAEKGNLPIINLLLTHGANTHIRNVLGQTALAIAAANGHDDAVELLDKTYHLVAASSPKVHRCPTKVVPSFGSFMTIIGLLAS